jgi:nickel-type superoxide dismutase maturation protease
MLKMIRVTGVSLSPIYRDGDYVLVVTIPFFLSRIRVGDIVVFRQEYYGLMIKKVEEITENGNMFFVVGTHQDSTDSRRFGQVMRQDILGKVLWHVRKPSL